MVDDIRSCHGGDDSLTLLRKSGCASRTTCCSPISPAQEASTVRQGTLHELQLKDSRNKYCHPPCKRRLCLWVGSASNSLSSEPGQDASLGRQSACQACAHTHLVVVVLVSMLVVVLVPMLVVVLQTTQKGKTVKRWHALQQHNDMYRHQRTLSATVKCFSQLNTARQSS